MEKKGYKIVVIDIGKTNKKISVLSENLEFIYSESTQIDVIEKDNIICDNITQTTDWLLKKLRGICAEYEIKVISVTTFGATVTHIDRNGNLVLPVISYTHEPGETIREEFYKKFGSKEELYLRTATPPFPQLLTVAMQLFWIKETKPELWEQIDRILFLPQYFGYIFTGKSIVEYTSIGCHTYLYDFNKNYWSDIAIKLDIGKRMPEKINYPWNILGKVNKKFCEQVGIDDSCIITAGIHDSNASLLPYLIGKKKDFILASTGTWSVFMYPNSGFYLSVDDMYKDTLYYIDPFGHPVRASRFKCGEEHDYYTKLIIEKFNQDPKRLKLDIRVIKEIIESCDCFVIPTLTPGSGQFPNSKPRIINEKKFYSDYITAYHVLCLSLAIQSYFAIKQIINEKRNTMIYVEGGFRNNDIYIKLLSSLFKKNKVFSTDVKQATSLGAGICAKCAYEGISPEELSQDLVDTDEILIDKIELDQNLTEKYITKFKDYCSE